MAETRAVSPKTILAAAAIILAGIGAYANSFSGPLVYDDGSSIATNATIRSLWPIGPILSPPTAGSTVGGRPIVNLSFAGNYALGGLDVRDYHAVNLAIHVLASLALFGILRRTLSRVALDQYGLGGDTNLISLAISVLWCVHPLQTESVTYISQRAESLMGLFYLLTLYGFVRGAESIRPSGWFLASVAACALGMATKEVMVSAPLIVLLYDRTFIAGTFRGALRQRPAVYAALAGTWIILAALVTETHGRGGTAGFATSVSWQAYLATQFPAIVNYLRLSVWPSPLIFGHGGSLTRGILTIVPSAFLVLGLAAGTIVAMRRAPKLGFLGAWFFAILAPSSSFVPIATETTAEHRMYLPLAAVISGLVLAVWMRLGRRSLILFGGAAAALTVLTLRRNLDYRSNLALWNDSVMKQPANPLAHFNLGVALSIDGYANAADAQYQVAVRLEPDYPEALLNLGNDRLREGRASEAISCFTKALRARPAYAEACDALGTALLNEGHAGEGMAWMRRAVRLRPDFSEAHHNLGLALAKEGREAEAIAEFRGVVRLQPADSDSRANLAVTLAYFGHLDDAIAEYERALELRPDFAFADYNLGNALMQSGRIREAIYRYQESLRLDPGYAEAHANLGVALTRMNRTLEAAGQFDQALKINPGDPADHRNLGLALRILGRNEEADRELQAALLLEQTRR